MKVMKPHKKHERLLLEEEKQYILSKLRKSRKNSKRYQKYQNRVEEIRVRIAASLKKPRKLTIWFYSPHKMAELREGSHSIFMGNLWDFHPGCHGTVFTMKDGKKIDVGNTWAGPGGLARELALRIEADVVTKDRTKPF